MCRPSRSKTAGLTHLYPVNLENAMRLGDRGRTPVSGHVDGIGQVVSLEQAAGEPQAVTLPRASFAPASPTRARSVVNGVFTINEVEDNSLSAPASRSISSRNTRWKHTLFTSPWKAQSLVNLPAEG